MWDCWNDWRGWNKDRKGQGLFPSAQSVWEFVCMCVSVCVCVCRTVWVWGVCVCVCVCACVHVWEGMFFYVEVCISLQVWFFKCCRGSKVRIVSCAFTSGCQWPLGLPAQPPLQPLDSDGEVPGCDCVGERWSLPYWLSPCRLVAVGGGAPARGGRARGDGGVRQWNRREMEQGRSTGSGCHTKPPNFAHTAAGRSVSTPPLPPHHS